MYVNTLVAQTHSVFYGNEFMHVYFYSDYKIRLKFKIRGGCSQVSQVHKYRTE